MRELTEARKEFNSVMKDYTAMIIQTEHTEFSDNFFIKNGLIPPSNRIAYTPPSWVGAEYASYFFAAYGREKPKKWRGEKVDTIDSSKKYLICDDYSGDGETLEIAIIRLIEAGVGLEKIWGITQEGNQEYKGIVLGKGTEWHNYRIQSHGMIRALLENLGFTYPSFQAKNL